jgi:hypothetical protein
MGLLQCSHDPEKEILDLVPFRAQTALRLKQRGALHLSQHFRNAAKHKLGSAHLQTLRASQGIIV